MPVRTGPVRHGDDIEAPPAGEDDRSPDWVLRGSTNFTALYFALYHGAEAGRAGEARALGYHVALDAPKTMTLGKVEDMLRPR